MAKPEINAMRKYNLPAGSGKQSIVLNNNIIYYRLLHIDPSNEKTTRRRNLYLLYMCICIPYTYFHGLGSSNLNIFVEMN